MRWARSCTSASAALVLPVAYRSAGAASGASLLAMLRDGWRFARSERLIVGTLAVTLIVNLWGFAYITMVPVIGERVLGLSPALIGVLMSSEGLGAVIGALLVARYDRPRRYTQIYTPRPQPSCSACSRSRCPPGSPCRSR